MGSVLELADASGNLVTHYTFGPFGATTASGTASTNSQQFTARENDGNGLHFFRARYYHPQLQRFIAEDPIGFEGGDLNLHAYVSNDPVSKWDPLGLYVKNCTDEPIKVKPENAGDPPYIVPPMTECIECSPDGVAPMGKPWTKTPSKVLSSDVTVTRAKPGSALEVSCSFGSPCWFWGAQPYIPGLGDADYRNMLADKDWWKPPVPLPKDYTTRKLTPKDCGK